MQKLKRIFDLSIFVTVLLYGSAATAQERLAETRTPNLDSIVVTATKKQEDQQDVPIAVTGFGERQLEAIGFRDLSSLTVAIPNVSLDDNGQVKGYANFTIRGQGINSSIPSLDPTVGLFVDGVYQGVSAGQVLDNFDIEAVEILRGPQGVYFGRNVTGGAVLIRTKRPTNDFTANARVAVETGLRVISDAAISGPLIKEKLKAKIAAYYSKDDGWFTNDFDNSEFGKDEQFLIRPSLELRIANNIDVFLHYEYGSAKGDGPAGQNHAIYDRGSHDFSINERGFYDNSWQGVTAETNIEVAFGGGKITNVFGWRTFESDAYLDVDSTVNSVFDAGTYLDQEQYSNELRYAGVFGPVDVTAGVYYFTQDLLFLEHRSLAGGVTSLDGGGQGTFSNWGIFLAGDWHISNEWTLNIGGRFGKEKKDAEVSTLRPGGSDYASRSGLVSDFSGGDKWSSFSPKVGLQWEPDSSTQAYVYAAQGYRSGGYNFRNTVLGAAPGPYDQEKNLTIEFGLKKDLFDGRSRLNLAVFRNTIDDIQRDVQVPLAGVGIVQRIENVGKAKVLGFEAESQYAVTNHLTIAGFVGYLHSEYKSLHIDLNRDGILNDLDYDLKLPRLAPWTYGANLDLNFPVSFGEISGRLAYSHRDKAFHTDDNVGFFAPIDTLDAGLMYSPGAGNLKISFYGKNLTNEATHGVDLVLPDAPPFGGDGNPANAGPTFSPLTRGRVVGVEFRLMY
ncbi:TonB-dependent receptor [Hyphococcus sp.]|uniref:TonB-dependent receptor n=1 Tax=Hyphococcus sp. TaxID=2038636 RepID=UPI0035C6D08F